MASALKSIAEKASKILNGYGGPKSKDNDAITEYVRSLLLRLHLATSSTVQNIQVIDVILFVADINA